MLVSGRTSDGAAKLLLSTTFFVGGPSFSDHEIPIRIEHVLTCKVNFLFR